MSTVWTVTDTTNGAFKSLGGATTVTFSSMAFNTGTGVALIAMQNNNSQALASATIGGTAATIVVQSGNTGSAGIITAIISRQNMTAGNANVVLNVASNGFNFAGCIAGTLTNDLEPASSSVFVTAAFNPGAAGSLTIPAGGVGLVVGELNATSTGVTWVPTGTGYATDANFNSSGVNVGLIAGHFTGSCSPQYAFGGNNAGLAAAAWGTNFTWLMMGDFDADIPLYRSKIEVVAHD